MPAGILRHLQQGPIGLRQHSLLPTHQPRPHRPHPSRKQLASYVGLTPMPYQSGTMDRDRRIGRAGNPRARTTMVQLAWLWLRYQPESALAAWFRARVGTLQGRTRRIAIVAMARKLLIALWRYTETGQIPDGVTVSAT